MTVSPTLLDAHDLDALFALKQSCPALASRVDYLADLLRLGPRALVESDELQRFVVLLGDKPIPILVNPGSELRCCLVSPDVHYVQYMKFELDKLAPDPRAHAMKVAVDWMGKIARPLGFNRCVSINNWLFTTSPELTLSAEELRSLRDFLCRRFPDHALVIRNIDARAPATSRLFADAGFRLVLNRPVHEWSPDRLDRRARSNLKAEFRLLASPRYVISYPAVLAPGDEDRIAFLYRKLYLDKHSTHNPHYTPRFFRAIHESGIAQYTTVSVDGTIMAFGTRFEDGERVVMALVGYETDADQHEYPFYRLLFASVLEAALEQRRRVFLSTGAATFKRRRGSYEWFEYEAVYDGHLPLHRRVPWALFRTVMNLGAQGLDTTQL